MQSTKIAVKKGTCRACKQAFAVGDTVVRLRLRKTYRQPCVTCAHKLIGVRWFHPQCVPVDVNAAMGYDPNPQPAANSYVPPPPPPTSHAHTVAPPPKPLSLEEKQFKVLSDTIDVLKARCAANPSIKAQLAPLFKTFQGLTARALRPGTEPEGIVALKMSMKKALDLVF